MLLRFGLAVLQIKRFVHHYRFTFSGAVSSTALIYQVAPLTGDTAVKRYDKMATGSTDKSTDIMYIDGAVGPHVDIYE